MGFSRASKNLIYKTMGKLKHVAATAASAAMKPTDSSQYERIGNQLYKRKPKK